VSLRAKSPKQQSSFGFKEDSASDTEAWTLSWIEFFSCSGVSAVNPTKPPPPPPSQFWHTPRSKWLTATKAKKAIDATLSIMSPRCGSYDDWKLCDERFLSVVFSAVLHMYPLVLLFYSVLGSFVRNLLFVRQWTMAGIWQEWGYPIWEIALFLRASCQVIN
jgi:hypothetical protein